MNIIFPSTLDNVRKVDQFWEEERNAASNAGFNVSYVSNTHFNCDLEFSKLSDEVSIYRGWIIGQDVYKNIDLKTKLYNSSEDYNWAYCLPTWYECLIDYTPKSYVLSKSDFEQFGIDNFLNDVVPKAGSFILKDFLKSRKHEWFDACFIRDISDIDEVKRVVKNFVNLQGEDFYGGLVFREFLNLKKAGFHPKSKMPLPIEFRTFFLNGRPFYTTPYWSSDIPYSNASNPPQGWLEEVGRKLKSNFVALDIAQDENDKWWVIEVNAGNSAGLPDRTDPEEFYKLLKEAI